jgi:hypothetical protein
MVTLRRPRSAIVLLAVPLLLAATGCGGDDSASTTTAAPTTAADGDQADGKVDEGGGDESDLGSWDRTAGPYRSRIGEQIEIDCDPGGGAGEVWGTNLYTDDSSICTAAVHQGLITFDDGGTVTIEIAEGADEYVGSEANGVTSMSYGSWGGSFEFPDAESLQTVATIDWSRNAGFYNDRTTNEFTVECEAGGTPGSVWGTGTYTDDSSICTAAVHAGLITVVDGGEVTFRLVAGQESYDGSSANGVDSSDYGSWGGSFEFVAA